LAINQVFDSIGRRNLFLDEVVMLIGDGVPKFIERAFHATGTIATKNQIEQTMKEFLWIYERNPISLTTVFPGVFLMLESLQKKGVKLGICTNKPYEAAMEVLIKLGLKSFFQSVIGGDSLGDIRKPDPRHFFAALDPLGIEKKFSLMIGDSKNDIAVAKKAGVKSVAVSFGYSSTKFDELGADFCICHFDELIPTLENF
jgi:phosphoglycolate phosphatase